MLNINNENVSKLKKKGKCVLVAGALGWTMCLSGCFPSELATNANISYDMLDTMDDDVLENGITQVLDVPGEDFKLVVEYKCELEEGERWTVTSDKQVTMEIRTDGLISGEVYIDNVHTDTTICSYYPTVDGITQDTMDDRIHNAQMIGFPIADDVSYIGVNQIEGQNETFITGTMHGFNGYSSGSVSERRYLESDYLEKGVYANKITSVIDLIVIKDGKTKCVSVPSKIQISVWPFICVQDYDGQIFYKYFYYDEEKNELEYQQLTESEYLVKIDQNLQKKLK